jgi:hypothetical protein
MALVHLTCQYGDFQTLSGAQNDAESSLEGATRPGSALCNSMQQPTNTPGNITMDVTRSSCGMQLLFDSAQLTKHA